MSITITPKEGEEVLLHLHKSIFVMWKQMLVFATAIITSVILFTFLYKYPVASIIAAILLLVSFIYSFYYFLIWYYDVHIITNLRIVTNTKTNLFNREVSEFYYNDVTDISYKIKGVLATVFQFGTVLVALRSGLTRELDYLSTPGVVQETLKNLVDATNNKKYH